jgi:hypothetical protein
VKDSKGNEITAGDEVLVPDPISGDIHVHSFSGAVEGYHDKYVVVSDGDGDCFDIEPERLTVT